ncbi:hypothetical protein [Pandoraea apista]|uniref:hypothetical protein n=1 Tax=Pandoraea apista TaxID=93218 RepID=UPI000ABB41C1|nr:hypothetical protein [Pandoraea apista]
MFFPIVMCRVVQAMTSMGEPVIHRHCRYPQAPAGRHPEPIRESRARAAKGVDTAGGLQ